MTTSHVVYALRTADRSETVYVGVTNDFNRRHREHSRRQEFGGLLMVPLGIFASRTIAERVEANTIRALRPRLNGVQPRLAERRHDPSPIQVILSELFAPLFDELRSQEAAV